MLSSIDGNQRGGDPLVIHVHQGAGSGLDADKLDGLQGQQFLRSDRAGEIDAGNNAQVLRLKRSGATANQVVLAFTYSDQETTVSKFLGIHNGDLKIGGSANLASGGKRVFHEGFMGPGSGLNADMVDGKHASQFLRSDAPNTSIPLENKEQRDITVDGELFWDKSAGIYIQSRNANHNRPALAWTSANVTIGSGLSVNYDSEDKPSLRIPQGSASGLNADLLDGYHAQFFRDASNLINGTLPKGRLAGTYNIDIAGSADKLDGQHASSLSVAIRRPIRCRPRCGQRREPRSGQPQRCRHHTAHVQIPATVRPVVRSERYLPFVLRAMPSDVGRSVGHLDRRQRLRDERDHGDGADLCAR
nr:hypothetical protein [Halolamina pelagica]